MNLYFAIIHSCLNYGTNKCISIELTSKQKQAVTVIKNNKALNTNVKRKVLNILNLFELNIYQMFILMFGTAQGTIPSFFQRRFKRMTYAYPPRLREGNYS